MRAALPAVVGLTAGVFVAALTVALPIMGALLLGDVALAILNRSAPPMNVYFVGMPPTIMVGCSALLPALPLAITTVGRLLSAISRDMIVLLGRLPR